MLLQYCLTCLGFLLLVLHEGKGAFIREGNRKRFKMCCLVNPDPRPEPGSVEISAPVCPPLQGTEHFLYDNKVAAPDIRLFISDIQPNIKILFKKQRPETSIAHWRF